MRIKNKLLAFGTVLLFLIALIGIGVFRKLEEKKIVKKNISTLDLIKYSSVDGSHHAIASSDRVKVLFFFNTECEHCQKEANLISKNALVLKSADIYFFSIEALPAIEKFAKQYKLLEHSDFKIGQVEYKEVFHKMGVNTYPMCFVYSPDGKLLKRYIGEVKVEAINKYWK